MGNKFIRAAFAGLLLGFVAATAAAQVNVSISFFHESLAPHGRWVASGSYGDVWVPGGVAAGWSPYVDGEWQWTDYGWTWASSDPWGDIAYHYGTWVWSPPYGWVWVPGTVWAPAWVTWAYTDDYIGWAPVPVSFAVTVNGYAGPAIAAPRASYVFVPARQFTPGVRVATVRVPAAQSPAIYARAHRATAFPVTAGVVHNTGLPVARVEKVTGRRVEIARADAERLRVAPIPKGKAAKYQVVAPNAERAAAIQAGRGKGSQKAERAEAKPEPRGQAKKKAAPEARPQPSESHAARAHETAPKREPVEARPQPSESHARGHEPKPKKEPAERPSPQAQAAPRDSSPRQVAPAEPKAAPREAQHGNPNAHGHAAQPKPGNAHGNGQPHDKDNGPGKPQPR